MRIAKFKLSMITLTVLFGPCAFSMHMPMQIQEVPLERLTKNLTTQIANFNSTYGVYDWRKADLIEALARLHSMAYALKLESIKAETPRFRETDIYRGKLSDDLVWRPRFDELIPKPKDDPDDRANGIIFSPDRGGREFPLAIPAKNEKQKTSALTHLNEAIRLYREAYDYDRNRPTVILGLGWCYEQRGDLEIAKRYYRENLNLLKKDLHNSMFLSDNTKMEVILPYRPEMRQFQIVKEGEIVLSTSVQLSTVNQLFNFSTMNLLTQFAADSDVMKINTALSKLNDSFYMQSPSKRNLNFSALLSAVNTTVGKIDQKASVEVQSLKTLPKDLEVAWGRTDEIWPKKPDGNAEIDVKWTVQSDGFNDVESVQIIPVKFGKSARHEMEKSTASQRVGDAKPHQIQLVDTKGKIVDSLKYDLKIFAGNDVTEKIPKDFSVDDQLGRLARAEAIIYLDHLLNPIADASEKLEIKKVTWALKLRKRSALRGMTPILVPLLKKENSRIQKESDAEQYLDRSAHVAFDLDGSRENQSWDWINPNAGWLVYVPPGKDLSTIDSGIYLFGSVSFWIFWRSGYDALCALDNNGDGKISGPELRNLAIWQDKNKNAKVDPGEVKSLVEWGITSLACRHQGNKIQWNPRGVTWKSGQVSPTYDVLLRRK